MRSSASNIVEPAQSTAPERPSRSFWSSFFLAWLGSCGLICAELVLTLVLKHQSITSSWELQRGCQGLAPAWAWLAVVPALGATLLLRYVLDRNSEPSRRTRLLCVLIVTALGGALGWGVGGGRHLAQLPIRLGFSWVVACAVGLCAALVLLPLHRLIRRSSKTKWALGAALLLLALVVEVVNGTVLVRLYPAFHWALSGLGLSLAACASLLATSDGTANTPRDTVDVLQLKQLLSVRIYTGISVSVFLVSLLALVPASRFISGFDNFRFLMTEAHPTLALGTELASHVVPPPPIDPSALTRPLGAARPRTSDQLSLAGRSILLISIDALRADHLGCYGYGRPTSPAMDQLAREGVRFDAAYAPTPHTSYSVTSLMTGKYMRPLLLQGAGEDSELWATLMQTYGYRTAAFFPPAVFFIDRERFAAFEKQNLGFEYAKIEFAEGERRLAQVSEYLKSAPTERPLFLWVHLFGPHEPYVADPKFDFGHQDIDRYDSEIRAADQSVGSLVELMRRRDPNSLVILTADHGEEFGDHGGRYHGTSVYDEQVRVPLIISTAGASAGRVVTKPVQTINLLPTVLSGLDVPVPPRLRGNTLLGELIGAEPDHTEQLGLALAETDDYTLLAEGSERLICQRRSGACRLFDTKSDPRQLQDLSGERETQSQKLKARARALAESHGEFESQGLRADGKGWPKSILLGLSGNAEVVPELARLLDDADVEVRRKSAELLFELPSTGQSTALRLALTREEDPGTRAWLALALTRLGQGVPLVVELLSDKDSEVRRRAALVLAEQGNDEGESELIRWLMDEKGQDQRQAVAILRGLAKIRSKDALPVLLRRLGDVRLRVEIANTLAKIGDKDARGPLSLALRTERFQSARSPLAEALYQLGGKDELIVPLRRFLGTPDPMPQGLDLALRAGILGEIGGPKEKDLVRLKQLGDSGVRVTVVVPPLSNKHDGLGGSRLILRLRSRHALPADVYIQPGVTQWGKSPTFRKQPQIDRERALVLNWPEQQVGSDGWTAVSELHALLPHHFEARPGQAITLELYATSALEVSALAVLPLQKELPPPPPEPWKPGAAPKD